ncbi:MAG: rhodanese-like domain-containing protein [Bacteroidota bacterium]
MKHSATIMFILFSSFMLHAQQGVKYLQPRQFQEVMQKQKGILLDVRTPAEFKKGHLKGAQLMNIFDDDFEARINKLDRNAVYYVYCGSGGRSSECTEMMAKKGFKNVVELEGGTSNWLKNGMPLVTD